MKHLDTLIIGGGQAGLATSYYLTQAGREHLILEKKRTGKAWRDERWDSFTLVTPNWLLRLPDMEYDGDDPDGFLTRDEVVEYLDRLIVWATGYNYDFSWVNFPIFDEFGYPQQERGITPQPGLYFVGLHWLHTIKSGLLVGVGDDAAYVVEHIESRPQ